MTEPVLDSTVVADGLARLTSMYVNQPNIRKIVTALLTPKQTLSTQLFNVYVQRRLSTATLYTLPLTNSVLDAIGALIGEGRNGLSDANYQAILFLAAAVNKSNAICPDWSNFATILLNTSAGPTVFLEGTAAYDFGMLDMTLPPIPVAAVLSKAVPNGVRSAFWYSTWDHSLNFTWGSHYSGGAGSSQGFGSVYSPTVGNLLIAAQPMTPDPATLPGAGEQFSPDMIPGLVFWTNANSLNTSPVASWSYGPANMTGTGGTEPTWTSTSLNVHNESVLYSGTQLLTTPSTPALQITGDITISSVMYVASYPGGVPATILSKGSVSEYDFYATSGGLVVFVRNGTALSTAGAVFSTALAFIVTVVQKANVVDIYVNGSNVLHSTSGVTPPTTTNAVQLGERSGAGTVLDGEQPETIVYNSALSSAQLENLHAYLGAKYDIPVH